LINAGNDLLGHGVGQLFWNQRTNANLKKRPTREKTGNT
jgi:hypothetical protein